MSFRILVTAGPTHEPIDEVRYLANRSSGKLGIALAEAAALAGHRVRLLLGPVDGGASKEVTTLRYTTTADLQALLESHFEACDVLVMAAAVADYCMAGGGAGKLERSADGLTLRLDPTPDLVAACASSKRADQRIVGFALEQSDRLAERAKRKMQRKHLDAIVANPLKTMGAADIEATVFVADGRRLRPGPMSKTAFAEWLVENLSAVVGLQDAVR